MEGPHMSRFVRALVFVAREVGCYEVLPGATESPGQASPEEPGQGQQLPPEDEAAQETPGQ